MLMDNTLELLGITDSGDWYITRYGDELSEVS